LNLEYSNKHVIIVDNASNNGSKEKLEERYAKQQEITLLFSDRNLGFSLGNNLGFSYAKNELKADFIALSNNDIIIKDSLLADKVISKYDAMKFDILGPDIISTVDNLHQNPRFELYDSIDRLEKFTKNFRRLLLLSFLSLDVLLVDLKKKIKPTSRLPSYKTDINHYQEQWNVKLHGSFWVFSPDYINQYEGLYPLQSMHMEESILNYIVKRDKLRTVYYPDCVVYHKEDSSTNHVYGKGVHKRRFYYRNCLQSIRALKDLMKADESIRSND